MHSDAFYDPQTSGSGSSTAAAEHLEVSEKSEWLLTKWPTPRTPSMSSPRPRSNRRCVVTSRSP